MDTWLITTSYCDFNVIMDVNVMIGLTVVPKNFVCEVDWDLFPGGAHVKFKRGLQPQCKTEVGRYRRRPE